MCLTGFGQAIGAFNSMRGTPAKKDRVLEIMDKMKALYLAKNKDYAGEGRQFGNFERCSAILKLYPGFPYDTPVGFAAILKLKQIDSVLHKLAEKTEFEVEGAGSRLEDEAVYSILQEVMLEMAGEEAQTKAVDINKPPMPRPEDYQNVAANTPRPPPLPRRGYYQDGTPRPLPKEPGI